MNRGATTSASMPSARAPAKISSVTRATRDQPFRLRSVSRIHFDLVERDGPVGLEHADVSRVEASVELQVPHLEMLRACRDVREGGAVRGDLELERQDVVEPAV